MVGQSSVEGVLAGSKNEPLVGVTVNLLRKSDSSVVRRTVSAPGGDFILKEISNGNYVVRISSLGYKITYKNLSIQSPQKIQYGRIAMQEEAHVLSTFVFTQKTVVAELKGDTTEFNAAAVKVNKDAVAEDLVKKLPGITVENGTIKAHGEEIKKVLVDNKEFFGNDASIALKNLPAEIIDRVQLYDKASEESEFTGFKDSETTKTLNFKTKKEKRNGIFGKFLAGYGSYDKYKFNGNLNLFNGVRRISFIGGTNNMNEQNFSAQDILVVGKMGGMPGGKGSTTNSMVGQNSGINTNTNVGMNYSDEWNNRWKVTGSYFYNQTNNKTSTETDRTYFVNDSTSEYYKEKSTTASNNYNHRFNMRVEGKLDSMSSLLITPSLSIQKNNASGKTEVGSYDNANNLLSGNTTTSNSDNSGYNFSNDIIYRHRFAKKGRSLFIDLSQTANNKDGTSQSISSLSNQEAKTNASDLNLSFRISYTEPLSKYSLLRFNYNPSTAENKTDKTTKLYNETAADYTKIDSALSTNYTVTTNTQQGGIGYLFNRKKLNFNIEGNYQVQTLKGEETFPETVTTNKNFRNWLMHSDVFYTINKRTFVHAGYNAQTTTPSITQLQNVTDNSNALSQTQGNPDLEQQYTHNFRGMFRSVDYTLTKVFFIRADASFSNNYIGSSTYTATNDVIINGASLTSGAKLTRPMNLSGYMTANVATGYSLPIYLIKSNLNLNGGYAYTKLPGIINETKNIATTNGVNGSVGIASNISENVDFNLSYRGNYNMVNNSLQTTGNENYYSGNATAKVTLVPTKHIVISSDANLNHYVGLGEEYDKATILLNASLAYKFMKNNAAEIRLTVYDLLNQNKSINRTVNDTYIETTNTETLRQYVLLTFSYNIRNFKGI
ncbi:MAG: TonB-dependent receptor [Paludibacteraceae bacterium]|nr:TonB-dependent receptor [Paludibacteraceae bacterium]